MANEEFKASRETALNLLDRLLNWERDNKPTASHEIRVSMTVKELEKFAVRVDAKDDTLWHYRGRILRKVRGG
jgi:hypothetical protein